jgi:hypothetical protein
MLDGILRSVPLTMLLEKVRRMRPILGGLKQFVVGYSAEGESVGGNIHARYCYSVWLRHFTAWRRAWMTRPVRPLRSWGPGDSLGTGMAALLSRVSSYYAFDVVDYSKTSPDLVETIADRHRSNIPGENEFPELEPKLDSYELPPDLLTERDLDTSVSPERLNKIREALISRGHGSGDINIRYYVPWNDNSVILPGSVDGAFSQAVIKHVNDIAATYRALATWVCDGGYV